MTLFHSIVFGDKRALLVVLLYVTIMFLDRVCRIWLGIVVIDIIVAVVVACLSCGFIVVVQWLGSNTLFAESCIVVTAISFRTQCVVNFSFLSQYFFFTPLADLVLLVTALRLAKPTRRFAPFTYNVNGLLDFLFGVHARHEFVAILEIGNSRRIVVHLNASHTINISFFVGPSTPQFFVNRVLIAAFNHMMIGFVFVSQRF
mmetsp:Transcript_19834/g.34034  ORF Transcript_19834/g.34034 Transcript_19834/m.34034 type:complete len:202 (-) Transcript_19834:2341-2946(-)